MALGRAGVSQHQVESVARAKRLRCPGLLVLCLGRARPFKGAVPNEFMAFPGLGNG